MKRELKLTILVTVGCSITEDCRAYPDEKGIETYDQGTEKSQPPDCRAYPDEKGIETGHMMP